MVRSKDRYNVNGIVRNRLKGVVLTKETCLSGGDHLYLQLSMKPEYDILSSPIQLFPDEYLCDSYCILIVHSQKQDRYGSFCNLLSYANLAVEIVLSHD